MNDLDKMNGLDTERIKSKFYARLKEEEKLKNKKAKLTSIIAVSAIVSLTSITIFAANLGIFNTLFNNFNDVSNSVKYSNTKVKSNGITMTLSSYLADNMGIVPELIFTKNDGSSFASDTIAGYTSGYRDGFPSIKINNIERSIEPQNQVSDDGKTYYCLPIIHYDIENVTNSTIDIRIDRLIYNIEDSNETVDLDLYNAYKKANVKIYNIADQQDTELKKIFDGVLDNPIQTKIGVTIDSIIFAKVKASPPEIVNGMPPADGVDIAGLSTQQYDNIIAIKFTNSIKKDNKEYNFRIMNLVNNNDPLGICLSLDNDTSYQFLRVNDFEDLKNMNGINFKTNSYNFIDGNWHIKTNFTSNQSQSTISINKDYEFKNLDTVMTLTKADISLFSTKLYFEIKDSNGNLLTNITGFDMNTYYLKIISNNNVKLLYSDGSEVNLLDFSFTSQPDEVINVRYNIEMNPDNYTLMNTSKLSAIVINGEVFKTN